VFVSHEVLPGAFDDEGITGHQIGASDLQIDGRLLMGLVSGVEYPARSFLVARAEAFLPAGGVVLNEKMPVLRLKRR
jgi:hypothetical protein